MKPISSSKHYIQWWRYLKRKLLNQVDINISTAEDPVEINLAGVNQVQVDERTGMTFDKALKAFLRQD